MCKNIDMGEHAMKRRSVSVVHRRPARRYFGGVALDRPGGNAFHGDGDCPDASVAGFGDRAAVHVVFGRRLSLHGLWRCPARSGAAAETTIGANEERCRTILRTSMDGFARTDIQGRFLEVNEAYCHLLGYRRDELLKKSIGEVVAGRTSEEIAARIRTVVHCGADRFETAPADQGWADRRT